VNATDSNLNFNNFIVAFQGLVGSPTQPTQAQMQTFTNFQLSVVEPPNPVRALDNSLNAAQTAGKGFFAGTRPADGIQLITGLTAFTCNGCHELDPAEGEFGTSKHGSFEGIIAQMFKIPHLRNMYTKVGMFGGGKINSFDAPDSGFTGDQIRGFGFTNEGSIDTIARCRLSLLRRSSINRLSIVNSQVLSELSPLNASSDPKARTNVSCTSSSISSLSPELTANRASASA